MQDTQVIHSPTQSIKVLYKYCVFKSWWVDRKIKKSYLLFYKSGGADAPLPAPLLPPPMIITEV